MRFITPFPTTDDGKAIYKAYSAGLAINATIVWHVPAHTSQEQSSTSRLKVIPWVSINQILVALWLTQIVAEYNVEGGEVPEHKK